MSYFIVPIILVVIILCLSKLYLLEQKRKQSLDKIIYDDLPDNVIHLEKYIERRKSLDDSDPPFAA